LAAGVATVLGLIIVLKVNAFIALISAAIVVSLLAGGPLATKISRVAEAFGSAAGNIGIVIALAAVIGTCLLDSGATDRIVRAFLALLGEKRSPIALMGSGFVLAVPVFFDTVFYLLVPLARSLFRTTQKDYLKYILAIAAGAAITHTLVPPTPGPLVMATTLGIDVGVMIGIGALVALPEAAAGLIFASIANRLMPIPMRQVGNRPERPPIKDEDLPPLWMAVLPVVLPVLLISTNTVMDTLAKNSVRSELAAAGVVLPAEERVAELISDPSDYYSLCWAASVLG
jgi:GntP family gluconate:H+ symporter